MSESLTILKFPTPTKGSQLTFNGPGISGISRQIPIVYHQLIRIIKKIIPRHNSPGHHDDVASDVVNSFVYLATPPIGRQVVSYHTSQYESITKQKNKQTLLGITQIIQQHISYTNIKLYSFYKNLVNHSIHKRLTLKSLTYYLNKQ